MLSSASRQILVLLLGCTFAVAQNYICKAGTGPIQAYSTVCPLTLTTGQRLVGKSIQNAYDTQQTQGGPTQDGDITFSCYYETFAVCSYTGGADRTTLRFGRSDSRCPRTTRAAPARPSGGGPFKKRTAEQVQSSQPRVTCPYDPNRQYPDSAALVSETFEVNDDVSTVDSPIVTIFYCTYSDDTACQYDPSTGDPSSDNVAVCPERACSAPEYQQRRSLAARQVKAASLRKKRPASAADQPKPLRRKRARGV